VSAPLAETITGQVALTIAGETIEVRVTVPPAETALSDLLPIFQELTDTIVNRGVALDAASGRSVSCRIGCAACCRQPVPISPSEARALAALVAAMPEPRRSTIRDRFASARATFAAAQVDTCSAAIARLRVEDQVAWGDAYLRATVACPFLEDESCSIYPDRPTICREYLVTTPAENCRTPTAETIRRVPLPGNVSVAIVAVDRRLDGDGPLLLVDSLDYAAAYPAPRPCESGPALVQAVFATIAAGSKI
jgi:Fe-S-cluster containining protein